jgi:hypothetical protein
VTTLYVVETGQWEGGDVSGMLITSEGEMLASHWSSSRSWLMSDLTSNFGRGTQLAERFGQFETVYVGLDDEIPSEIRHLYSDKDTAES